jgi:hypothetical protein
VCQTELALAVMGLKEDATRQAVKARYYELAKLTHPDVAGDAAPSGQPAFLEVQDAFEQLLAALAERADAATAPGSAARGGASPRRRAGARQTARRRTLAEVLCERLTEEPGAHAEVWADIVERELPVVGGVLDSLFRACAASGAGLPAGIDILRDAQRLDLLSRSVRLAAHVSLIKWCKEDKQSFETIWKEIPAADKEDRELRETVAYANMLYSGVDGYSK